MFAAGGRRFVWNLFFIVIVFCILIIINTPQRMTPLPKQVEGWELNITRETKIYVIPENDTSILIGKEVCKESLKFIIIVFSAPENFAQRYAIRETWGSYNITTIKVAFLLGCSKNSSTQLSVEEENNEFQDVIQEDFIDSYNNLTVKSVMMLKWFVSKCPSPIYLMKTDDDMFINIDYLSNLISKIKRHSILIGTLICKAKPIVDVHNKWYVPKYMYHKAFYPNYLSGTAYVMSRDVALKLYKAALSTTLIHLEDVYITGICAVKAGIKPQNFAGFSYEHFGTGCDSEMVTNHRLNPQQLRQVWNQRNNCTIRPKYPTSKPKSQNPCH